MAIDSKTSAPERVTNADSWNAMSVTIPHRTNRWTPGLLFLTDAVALTLSMLVGLWSLAQFETRGVGMPRLPGELIFVPAFLLGLLIHGTYFQDRQRVVESLGRTVWSVTQAMATGILIALAVDAALGAAPGAHHRRDLQLTQAVVLSLPALALVPALRALVLGTVCRSRRPSRVMIVGSGRVAAAVVGRLSRSSDVKVVGLVDDDPLHHEGMIGQLADLPELCRLHQVDRVVVAFSRTSLTETLEMLRHLGNGVTVSFVPRFYELLSWRSHVEEIDGIPIIHMAPSQLSSTGRCVKRAFDVVGALVVLVVLLPLIVGVALAIKMDSRGPVFFRQERTGWRGERFQIFKFRTMCVGAEAQRAELEAHNEVDGPIFKMKSDPRVTRLGRFLRMSSIDELPQLLNVLLGQMSLVGPRPFPVEESARIEGFATSRFAVRPGMTGLWQVSGRNDLTYDELCHLDTIYVASWSFWWDLRILFRTPGSVMSKRGVF